MSANTYRLKYDNFVEDDNVIWNDKLHNMHIYTSLEDIGLSDTDMDASDFLSNIIKIKEALPDNSEFRLVTIGESNLESSLITKVNTDMGTTYDSSINFTIYSEKANSTSPLKVDVMVDDNGDCVYTCILYNDADGNPTISPFTFLYHPKGFVVNEGHQIKTYTSYTQLGLTTSDMVADDFAANVQKIFEAMPNHSVLRMNAHDSNLANSTVNKVNADLNGTLSLSNDFVLTIEKTTSLFPARIDALLRYFKNTRIYTCLLFYDSESGYSITNFATTYNFNGYLPLTGGTLTGTTNITLADGNPIFYLERSNLDRRLWLEVGINGHVYVSARDVANENLTMFVIHPQTTELAYRVKIQNRVDGTSTNYNIFGQHNKPTGSYIGNGDATSRTIDVGGIGCVLYVVTVNGWALVSGGGAVVMDYSGVTRLSFDSVHFQSGVLTIATDNYIINNADTTVYYYLN